MWVENFPISSLPFPVPSGTTKSARGRQPACLYSTGDLVLSPWSALDEAIRAPQWESRGLWASLQQHDGYTACTFLPPLLGTFPVATTSLSGAMTSIRRDH